VQSVDNDGGGSPLSKSDLATTTIFSDDPILAGTTHVQAIHISEARTAVNSVRAACGLGAFPFTDPSVTGKIKGVHIQDLRTALNEALAIILGTPKSFTNPATVNSLIRGLDLTEVRDGVK